MSIRHMTDVWEDAYYDQKDKTLLLVALALADSARSEDGKCWPSIEYIAKKARTSVRGVQTATRELEADGRVIVRTGAGPRGTNIYIVCDPATAAPRNRCTPQPSAERLHPNHQEPSRDLRSSDTARKAASKTRIADVAFPLLLNTKEFHCEWEAFIEVRKTQRHPLTARAAELLLARLAERPQEAVAALQVAVINGWRGFEWEWYDNNKHKNTNGTKTNQGHPARSSRNIGTLNEGKSSAYRDIGKL